MRVLAVMPCLGREQQTLDLVSRLLRTALHGDWELMLISDGDRELGETLARAYSARVQVKTLVSGAGGRAGYWRCLKYAMNLNDSPFIVNLANDLLPGREWLSRAVEAYDERFGIGEGLIGFNDGIHDGQHSAHFLISRRLLHRWYGNDYWPLHYGHNFGDTEISQRAIALGAYAVAPWAVLYHNHPINGAASDEVYEAGARSDTMDANTFRRLREGAWK